MGQPLIVAIIDADQPSREAVRDTLKVMDVELREYALGKTFVESCDLCRPGCAIAELRLPDMSGLKLQEHLASHARTFPVIFLTQYGDTASCVQAMKAGAVDFLEKPFHHQHLWDAVHEALEQASERCAHRLARQQLECRFASLTTHEKQVLELVAEGKPNKAVASALSVSVRTVEIRRAQLMKKLQARTFPELIRLAFAYESGNSHKDLA